MVLGVGIDFAATGIFPFRIAEIAFVAFGDGSDEDVARQEDRVAGARADEAGVQEGEATPEEAKA